jgi:hypothetical protein
MMALGHTSSLTLSTLEGQRVKKKKKKKREVLWSDFPRGQLIRRTDANRESEKQSQLRGAAR